MRNVKGKPSRLKWVQFDKNEHMVGWIFMCVEPIEEEGAWITDPMPEGCWGVLDEQLEPLADPPDNAIDETLQRLGTPMDKNLRDMEVALRELKQVSRDLKELEKKLTSELVGE